MLVENQIIEIKVMNSNILNYYKDKGYNPEIGKNLSVRAEDLSAGSNKKVKVMCDYCGKEYKKVYKKYYDRDLNGIIKKCSCRDCENLKIKESNFKKYGMSTNSLSDVKAKKKQSYIDRYGKDNPMKCDEVKKKYVDTMKKRYGVAYMMESDFCKEKVKKTMIERYGVDHPSKSKEILAKREKSNLRKYGVAHTLQLEEVREKIAKTSFENGTAKLSVEQVYLSNLFNGTLNYPVGKYNVDILLGNNIILEFDGSGHDLNAFYGRLTDEQFLKREAERNSYLINRGFKIIRFIHRRHTKISDDKYFEALQQCKGELLTQDIVSYNFDNNILSIN